MITHALLIQVFFLYGKAVERKILGMLVNVSMSDLHFLPPLEKNEIFISIFEYLSLDKNKGKGKNIVL